jgi:hypothetical protein
MLQIAIYSFRGVAPVCWSGSEVESFGKPNPRDGYHVFMGGRNQIDEFVDWFCDDAPGVHTVDVLVVNSVLGTLKTTFHVV